MQGDGATTNPVFSGKRRRHRVVESRRARRDAGRTSARSPALSAGSTTSPARAATRPAASAVFIFPASTGWRPSHRIRNRGAGVAAFLRRPDPAPRHPELVRNGAAPGLFPRLFQPSAIAHARRNFSGELAGTDYYDGWGAHCYQQSPKAADNDPSFRPGPAPRGSPVRPPARPPGSGCALSSSAACPGRGAAYFALLRSAGTHSCVVQIDSALTNRVSSRQSPKEARRE